MVNAVVQLFVGFLQGDESGRGLGSIIMAIFRALLGAVVSIAWRLITWLVMPFIMFDEAGPVTAIKGSFGVFRDHWGTQIRGFARITFSRVLLLTLPGLLLMTLGSLLFHTVRGVFSVVMYRYLIDGSVLGGFSASQLDAAVMSDTSR